MKCKGPEKPANQKDQISMLWDAVYNHIPSRLKWQDIKINFILAFLMVVIVLAAITLAK